MSCISCQGTLLRASATSFASHLKPRRTRHPKSRTVCPAAFHREAKVCRRVLPLLVPRSRKKNSGSRVLPRAFTATLPGIHPLFYKFAVPAGRWLECGIGACRFYVACQRFALFEFCSRGLGDECQVGPLASAHSHGDGNRLQASEQKKI